jgi:hypothetical protein
LFPFLPFLPLLVIIVGKIEEMETIAIIQKKMENNRMRKNGF